MGLQRAVYISLVCSSKECSQLSFLSDHSFAVKSSEHETSSVPVGSHWMAFTSSLCPRNVFSGSLDPSLHTWICECGGGSARSQAMDVRAVRVARPDCGDAGGEGSWHGHVVES